MQPRTVKHLQRLVAVREGVRFVENGAIFSELVLQPGDDAFHIVLLLLQEHRGRRSGSQERNKVVRKDNITTTKYTNAFLALNPNIRRKGNFSDFFW